MIAKQDYRPIQTRSESLFFFFSYVVYVGDSGLWDPKKKRILNAVSVLMIIQAMWPKMIYVRKWLTLCFRNSWALLMKNGWSFYSILRVDFWPVLDFPCHRLSPFSLVLIPNNHRWKKQGKPGLVVHACIPRYWRGWSGQIASSRTVWAT